MDDDEILDGLEALIAEMRESKVLVVVEGQKDKHALAAFGITNVLTLQKPLFAVVEFIAKDNKEVVLLSDLDTEGKKIFVTLARDLQKHGVQIDDRLRKLLFKTPIRHIEGLATYLRNARSN